MAASTALVKILVRFCENYVNNLEIVYILVGHMLPNLTSEVHFILQLLTASTPHTTKHTSIESKQSFIESLRQIFWLYDTVLYNYVVACPSGIEHVPL